MATYTKYQLAVEHIANKEIDIYGATDTFKAIIHTDAPVVATDAALSDLTQIAGNNGYTTDGEDITFDSTFSGGTVTATATDVTWTAVTGNLGTSTTCRYVSYYDADGVNNYLMASWDYGSTFTVAVGETFTINFGASLFTFA